MLLSMRASIVDGGFAKRSHLQDAAQLERVSRQMREHWPSSLPGIARQKTRVNALMTRQSIDLRKDFLQKRWMRGSSPRMTS
jgi:hypothetical protein